MAERKRKAARKKTYSFDDMPTVDRPDFDLFGTKYDFVGAQDIGGQFMADARFLQDRINELEAAQADSEDEEEKVKLSQEMLEALMKMTQIIFVEEIPQEVLMRMSVRQHRFVHDSFTEASVGGGEDSAGA